MTGSYQSDGLKGDVFMIKILKISVLVTMFLIVSSSYVLAYDLENTKPSVAIKILDLSIVRPISMVVSIASTVFCVGTLPLTYPVGVSEPAARIFIEAPWRFTNARYLGKFNHYKDEKPVTVVYER